MKIVVSAAGAGSENEVDPRFGRAANFLVFDSARESWTLLENTQAPEAAHGAGIQAAETICRHGAEALITGRVGPKAFAVLSAGGVKVYRGDGRTAKEAVEEFRAGRLAEIKESDPAY